MWSKFVTETQETKFVTKDTPKGFASTSNSSSLWKYREEEFHLRIEDFKLYFGRSQI